MKWGRINYFLCPLNYSRIMVFTFFFSSHYIDQRLSVTDKTLVGLVGHTGKPGKQKTRFFKDFSINAIEVKAYKNEDEIFEQQWDVAS